MLPFTNLTFGSIVNTVFCGPVCGVAKLSKLVEMMLCSDTPPKTFLSCFAGASVVCKPIDVALAEAMLANVRAPIAPSSIPIRYLRFVMSVHS